MVRLGIPPRPDLVTIRVLFRVQNLSHDLALLPPLLLHLLCDFARDLLLLVVVVEDAAAVLGSPVRALTVGSGGVVHLVEELE